MALDTSVFHKSPALTQWLMPATDDRVVSGSNPSEWQCRRFASKLGLGRSASSFTKHRIGAYIRSTVYVDIISCWSLLYGVYDGGGGE